jgi:hypothetical protein
MDGTNMKNMMLFPATHFHGLTFSCISVSLNCMETALRFNFYELLDIIEHWEIMWDFDVETCETVEKLITSWNFNALRQEIVFKRETYQENNVNHVEKFWYEIIIKLKVGNILSRDITVFLVSDMCHVSCPSYPWLDHLTNLQNTDHEIPNYVVLFCLPFFVFLQSKLCKPFQDGCSLKN